MTVKSELLELQATHPLLQPVTIVEWARTNTKSALHANFEWDDRKAAHEHRLSQARHLIAVHVVDERGVRQMVSLSVDRTEPGGGYRALEVVMKAPDLREVLLADALADLERFRVKYEILLELAEVFSAHDRISKRARGKRGGRPSV